MEIYHAINESIKIQSKYPVQYPTLLQSLPFTSLYPSCMHTSPVHKSLYNIPPSLLISYPTLTNEKVIGVLEEINLRFYCNSEEAWLCI